MPTAQTLPEYRRRRMRTSRRNASDSDDNDTPPIQRVRWSTLRPEILLKWEPGEHVAILGPTGSGKTTLSFQLLNDRADRRGANVVALAQKRRDATLVKLGWPIIPAWPPDYEHREGRKFILWPPYGRASTARNNKAVFEHALDEILEEGGWTVYMDEVIYFTETLGLRPLLDEYWNTARSSHITVVGSAQGATWIPRAMTTQQAWIYVFKPRNEQLSIDFADVCGDRARFYPVIRSLREYEFLVVRTSGKAKRGADAYISKVGT